jgi:hypothetical protein
VIEREKAEIGVLITLEEATRPMRTETASAGFYESPGWAKKYPRLQILTVADLLGGKRIDYPPAAQVNVTFKRAPKARVGEAPAQAIFRWSQSRRHHGCPGVRNQTDALLAKRI